MRSHELTERQAEILDLVAHGYCYKEIAAKLHLCMSVVKQHTFRARRVLGAKSTAQAVAILVGGEEYRN